MKQKEIKVAIVHDWLVGYGGGERVVEDFVKVFPNAPIYTLVYAPNTLPKRFKNYDVRTTYLQKIPFATRLYKNMLTLMPKAWEALDLTEYDLVLSSCSSCCKGVITRPDSVHICYCHSPTRYLWDFYYTYMKNANWLKKKLMPSLIHKMRIWDKLAADRVDYFIANSNFIKKRIKKFYRKDADVIYPGVHINNYPIQDKAQDYYLVVSRFTYYKRIDLAVKACTKLGKKLVIIGGGEEEKKLKALAGSTIEFKGKVSDEEILNYYINAKAFLFPGEEDFGITPVEAQSAGVPIIAFGKGGALETVLDNKTGKFFYEQTEESLIDAIVEFEKNGVEYTRHQIREYSLKFSEERFRKEIESYCKSKIEKDLDCNKGLDV